jgi:hypothetical protein
VVEARASPEPVALAVTPEQEVVACLAEQDVGTRRAVDAIRLRPTGEPVGSGPARDGVVARTALERPVTSTSSGYAPSASAG